MVKSGLFGTSKSLQSLMWIEVESQVCLQSGTICNFKILADFVTCVSSPYLKGAVETGRHECENLFRPAWWRFWSFVRTHVGLSTSLGFQSFYSFPGSAPQPLSTLPEPKKIPPKGVLCQRHIGSQFVHTVPNQTPPDALSINQCYISVRCCFQYGHIRDRWYKVIMGEQLTNGSLFKMTKSFTHSCWFPK